MKALKFILVELTCLALLQGAGLWAQTWQTVDDYDDGSGQDHASDVAFEASGGIYVAGATFSPGLVGLVRYSHDGGVTWTNVEHFGTGFSAICVDGHGTVFAAGGAGLRKSLDQGITWVTADNSSFLGLGCDTNGTIYAVGNDANGWLVRKSLDGGATWQSTSTPGVDSGAAQKVVCLGTDVYIAGRSSGSGGWLVFRSSDQGDTWSLVDAPGASGGLDMTADARGNLTEQTYCGRPMRY